MTPFLIEQPFRRGFSVSGWASEVVAAFDDKLVTTCFKKQGRIPQEAGLAPTSEVLLAIKGQGRTHAIAWPDITSLTAHLDTFHSTVRFQVRGDTMRFDFHLPSAAAVALFPVLRERLGDRFMATADGTSRIRNRTNQGVFLIYLFVAGFTGVLIWMAQDVSQRGARHIGGRGRLLGLALEWSIRQFGVIPTSVGILVVGLLLANVVASDARRRLRAAPTESELQSAGFTPL
jgi:hypothetical protein